MAKSATSQPEHTLEEMVSAGLTRYRSVKTLKKFISRGELDAYDTAPPGSKYTRIVCTRDAIAAFNKKLNGRRPAAESLLSKQRPAAPKAETKAKKKTRR